MKIHSLGLVVVGLVCSFACSSAPPPEEIAASQRMAGGDTCSQVVLVASRGRHPRGSTDAHVQLGERMALVLPAEIPVTSGASGDHQALLKVGHGPRAVECSYQGNGTTAYVFERCRGRHGKRLAPGDALTGRDFSLEVKNGDRHFGTTTVKLVIDETRPCDPATRGEVAFQDRVLAGLEGNGRACSDCHMPSNNFELSPATAEARFQQMIASGIEDPLFQPLDADDFVINGESASDYGNLRHNGLIRIRMALPANIKLVDPASCQTAGLPAPCQTATTYAVSAATFTDVWRAVPSVLNVSISGPDGQAPIWPRGPNAQGGYQLDGRIDSLPNQALAALLNHAQVATPPDTRLLDDLAAYQTGLVTDAEPPPLDELEAAGKVVFDRACAQCHGGPGMTTPAPQVGRFHDIVAACPRPVDAVSPPRWNLAPCPPALARNARTYEISFPDGFKLRRTSSDPARALLSGFVFSAGLPAPGATCLHPPCGPNPADDWQKLDVPPLHGISKRAPYFHNNSAATLEDVVIQYEEFFKRASAVNPPPALPAILTSDGVNRDRPNIPSERAALVAYLKKL